LMIDAEQLEDVVESHTVLEGRTVSKRARRSHPVPLVMF